MMERAETLTAMADLKLFGMRAAYDELMAAASWRTPRPNPKWPGFAPTCGRILLRR